MRHFGNKFNIVKILIKLNIDLKLLIDYKLLILFKNSVFSFKYVGVHISVMTFQTVVFS